MGVYSLDRLAPSIRLIYGSRIIITSVLVSFPFLYCSENIILFLQAVGLPGIFPVSNGMISEEIFWSNRTRSSLQNSFTLELINNNWYDDRIKMLSTRLNGI